MRRRIVWLVVLVALLAPVFLAVLGSVACRVMDRMLAPSAWAQEFEFRKVPAESLNSLERPRSRRARSRDAAQAPAAPSTPATPVDPDEPGIPEAPETPEEPESPDVTIGGPSGLMRFGGDIHVRKGEVVDGDVFALRGDIRIDGHVKGDVAATSGDVFLGPSAKVDGDVLCIAGELHEEAGAWIGGQRVTALQGRRGKIRERIMDKIRDRDDDHDREGGIAFRLVWLMMWVGLAWLAARLFPVRTRTGVETVQREAGMSLMMGFLGCLLLLPSVVAMILVFAILCITILGIPLAFGVLIGYFLAIAALVMWGHVVGLAPVGEAFLRRTGRTADAADLSRSMMTGVLVVAGAAFLGRLFSGVPLIGGLGKVLEFLASAAIVLATMIGVGALIRSKLGQGPEGQWWPIRKRPLVQGPPPPATEPPAAPAPPSSGVPEPTG